MSGPVDIVAMDLARRQGDVSGTLIQIAPNGQSANIGGWTLVFSVQPGSSLLNITWNPPIGHSSGLPMTTVTSPFTVPGYNSNITIGVGSSGGIVPADWLFIQGMGVVQVQSVPDGTHLQLYNTGFPINLSSGSIASATPVFEASNLGYTVLVIPSTITDWNSSAPLTPTRSVGRFQYYLKYDTNDPSPGPYKKTIAQGYLYINPQNDPTA